MELDQYLCPKLLASAAVLLATWIIICLWNNRKLPPGPWGIPFLGYFPFINVTHEDYFRLSKIYGNVFSFRTIGGKLIVVLNGAKAIKEVLVNRADEFDGRPHENNMVAWISRGIGITQEEGTAWSEQRKFFLQTIRNFGVGKMEMEERITDEIQQCLAELRKFDQSKAVDMRSELAYSVNSVISHVLFGKKFDKGKTFHNILELTNNFVGLFTGKTHIILGLAYDLLFKIFPGMKTSQKFLDRYREFTDGIVDEQIRSFDASHQRGYVDTYLKHRNELQEKGKLGSSVFSMERLQANTLNLFFEGTESVSTTISAFLMELSKHPDVQKIAQAELDTVVGRERPPSWLDRQKLPYLDATIQELFRQASLFRVSTHYSNFEETTIEGYRIPRRSIVIANYYSIHFDPEVYPNPFVFDPKRFLDENGKRIKREGPYAFGIGKRACIGESLAQMEVFLIISTFLQNYTLHPTDEDFHLKLEPRR